MPAYLSGAPQSSVCVVNFRVIDNKGQAAPYRIGRLTDTKLSAITDGIDALSARVPCGRYSYELIRNDTTSAYANIRGSFYLTHPEEWLTVLTDPNTAVLPTGVYALSSARPEGFVVRGKVVNGVKNQRYWIRIESAFGHQTAETKSDDSGEFHLYHLPFGRCVISITEGDRIIYLEPLDTSNVGKAPLVIDLRAATTSGRPQE